MQRLAAVVLASCAAPAAEPGGTLVYATPDSYHVRLLDLATGTSQLIDDGRFGSVSLAPDGNHVAYEGVDQVIKVADRAGTITPLVPRSGCSGPATWLTPTALSFCLSSPQQQGSMVLPSLDAAPRFIPSYGTVLSPDAHSIAYVDMTGNVVIEDLAGTTSRVLLSSSTRAFSVMAFTPDERALLVFDTSSYPPTLRIVSLADGSSIDIPDALGMSTPFGTPTIRGASQFSPDGSAMLLGTQSGLVAVDLATGTKHVIVSFEPPISCGSAAYLDATHVLWVRLEDHSQGDIGLFQMSLHVAGPTPADDVVLDAPTVTNDWWPSLAVFPSGVIAVPSDVLLVRIDGTLVLNNGSPSRRADDILGLTPDGKSMITITLDGAVRMISDDGQVTDLVTAAGGGTGDDVTGPFAAYVPGIP